MRAPRMFKVTAVATQSAAPLYDQSAIEQRGEGVKLRCSLGESSTVIRQRFVVIIAELKSGFKFCFTELY